MKTRILGFLVRTSSLIFFITRENALLAPLFRLIRADISRYVLHVRGVGCVDVLKIVGISDKSSQLSPLLSCLSI